MWRPVVEADAMLKYSTCIFVKVVVIALIVSLNIQSIRDIGLNLAQLEVKRGVRKYVRVFVCFLFLARGFNYQLRSINSVSDKIKFFFSPWQDRL